MQLLNFNLLSLGHQKKADMINIPAQLVSLLGLHNHVLFKEINLCLINLKIQKENPKVVTEIDTEDMNITGDNAGPLTLKKKIL
uniref:Uncharacterized protein n=1 Tax=Stegastes partitus TaxID=144197 RepID=A0A3B4ZS33_9TELE